MQVKTLTTFGTLISLVDALKRCPVPISVDLETSGTDPFKDTIVGMSLCWGLDIEKEAIYVPLRHIYYQPFPAEDALRVLRPLVEEHSFMAFNAAFEMDFLRRQAGYNLEKMLPQVTDVQLVAYVHANYDVVSLKNVCKIEFPNDPDVKLESYSDFMTAQGLSAKKNSIAEVDAFKVADYCVRDSYAAYKVWDKLYPLVKDTQIYKLECKVLPVVMWLRSNGVMIDKEFFKKEKERLSLEVNYLQEVIEAQVTQLAGERLDFNLDSPKQLGDVLYGRLKLPCDKFSEKTGVASTGAESLNKLKWKHPVVKNIISYKEIKKRLSTYFDTYPNAAQDDGRIHASYNQTGVVTGRFSCSDPNLQNIPGKVTWEVESAGSKKTITTNLKSGFIVPDDCWLVEFDYNQIEARVAAGVTQEVVLLNAFNSGIDYHTKTASLIFNKPIEAISKEERQMGKKLNFALAYGMGPKKLYHELMKEIVVSLEQAKIFWRKYLDAYPTMFASAAKIADVAQQNGFVKTIFGRKVPVFNFLWATLQPDPRVKDGLIDEGRRMAYNAVVQGTAADTVKLAMVKLYKMIGTKYTYELVKLILTTHDSVSFQVNKSVPLVQFIKDVMAEMRVKLDNFPVFEAAVEVGTNWGNLKKIENDEAIEDFVERVLGGEKHIETVLKDSRKMFVVEFPEGQAKRTQGQIVELREFIDSRPGENKLVIKMGDKEKTYPIFTSIGIEDRERILLMVGGKFYERI